MSTIPGESSWADAGLLPPEHVEVPEIDVVDPTDLGTVPAAPRPDLRGEAAEPDVVEQAIEAGGDEEDYPEV